MSTYIQTGGPVPRERLDHAVEHGPKHLRAIYRAVRDHHVSLLVVPQCDDPFRLPDPCRPTICIIGDDFDKAPGPGAFHRPSIRHAIKNAAVVVVVSSGPEVAPYGIAAVTAIAGGPDDLLGLSANATRNAVIIETRPEREREWVNFVYKVRPKVRMVISTPNPNAFADIGISLARARQ